MIVVTYKRRHEIDGYIEETRLFTDEGDLKMYLWEELYCKNPIIVTGIWEVE